MDLSQASEPLLASAAGHPPAGYPACPAYAAPEGSVPGQVAARSPHSIVFMYQLNGLRAWLAHPVQRPDAGSGDPAFGSGDSIGHIRGQLAGSAVALDAS